MMMSENYGMVGSMGIGMPIVLLLVLLIGIGIGYAVGRAK